MQKIGRLSSKSGPPEAGTCFGDGYLAVLRDCRPSAEQYRLTRVLSTKLCDEALGLLKESGFVEKYEVNHVGGIGSTSRGTFAPGPVDFDLLISTSLRSRDICKSKYIEVCNRIVERVVLSGEYEAFMAQYNCGEPPVLESCDVRGTEPLVARYSHRIKIGGKNCQYILFDINIGHLPQLVSLGVESHVYFDRLSFVAAQRLRAEICLAKVCLRQLLELSRLSLRALPSHFIESLVVFSVEYRNPGLEVGTFDNALLFLDSSSEHFKSSPQLFGEHYPIYRFGHRAHLGLNADREALLNGNVFYRLSTEEQSEGWSALLEYARLYREARVEGLAFNPTEISETVARSQHKT